MKSARTSLLAVLAAVSFCSLGFAEGTEGNRDAYIGLPAYLYGRNSLFGLQGGFRLGPGQFRLDLQLSEDYRNGAESWSVLPSAGYFFMQDIQSAVRLRLYEGLTLGAEKGLANSFDGLVGVIAYIAGAEALFSDGTAFFVEIGSGASFPQKEGAFYGGTIVGGGFRYYLK